MDAFVPEDEGRESGRRSRVVLMPRRWHQLAMMLRITLGWWQESPITRESMKKAVKTIVQGMPECSANLWWLTRVLFFAREAAGEPDHPAFPAPSIWVAETLEQLGRVVSRDGVVMPFNWARR